LKGTSIDDLYSLKCFDEELRAILFKYLTRIEEEIRVFSSYKFDEINGKGKNFWYEVSAYNPLAPVSDVMKTISTIYSAIERNSSSYVKFYMNEHKFIPTWIMIRVINFSSLIYWIFASKYEVRDSICTLYGLDLNTNPTSLLEGCLHWIRIVRNACAHNERIFCLTTSSRFYEYYFQQLNTRYNRTSKKHLMDLFVYCKYFLSESDFNGMIGDIREKLLELQQTIDILPFARVRNAMGIKKLTDLDKFMAIPKPQRITYRI